MKRILRTPLAQGDLLEIWSFIAEERRRPAAADRLLRRFDEVLRHLLVHPEIGESYRGAASDVRLFPVGSYLIVYRSDSDGIELLRVVHGARDWKELLP